MPDEHPNSWRKRGYNPEFVRSVLARRRKMPQPGRGCVVRVPGVPLWVSELINETALKHGMDVGRITGKDRSVGAVNARNEVLYEVRRTNPRLSFPKIGMWFGRDHTAVMFAIASHARCNGLPKLTGFDLDRHHAARRRFIEKRRQQREAIRRNAHALDRETENPSGAR